MSILHKYFFKEFIRLFIIIQIVVIVILLSIDYLAKLDIFIGSQVSIVKTFEYVLLRAPIMLAGLIPSVVILSIIVVFGLMNRNNELVAIKSGGVSVYYLVRPVIFAGIALIGIMFFLGETIVPVTEAQSKVIKHEITHGGKTMHRAKKDVWMKQDNLIIHIKYFNPLDKTIAGIILTELDNKFNIIRRIDAQSGMYTEPTWLFSKVIEQIYDKTNLDYVVKTYKNKEYILNFLPKDIAKIVKKSDEMTMFELLKYVKKIEDEGYDATSYRVDFFAKTASPVVCLIMAMIGAAVGMRSLVKENMPAGIALGIGISFFYYIMHGFCISLGYGKVLPAFLSAWVTNIFFFIFAMLFLISIDD